MVQAIIFDFGGVLNAFDYSMVINRIAAGTGKTPEYIKAYLFTETHLPGRYDEGEFSSQEFMRRIQEGLGFEISEAEFIKQYNDIFTPITTTYDLVRQIKKSGKYKLGLLSNIGEIHHKYTLEKIPVYDLFDTYTLSYVVKAAKPKKEIYLDALQKLGVTPEEAVFIDDMQENIDAANALGIKGIRYQDHEQLMQDLSALGITFQE